MNSGISPSNEKAVPEACPSLYSRLSVASEEPSVTSPEEWKDLLNKMNAVNKVSDSFSETDIDFSEYTVIAVFDEIKNSGGHSLNLVIQETKDKILVEVLRKGPNGIATSVMTQPYYIVKIPKPSLPIVFE